MSNKIDIDEAHPSYRQFVECVISGASIQDIYVESTHGYAVRNEASEAETRRRRTVQARKQFMKVYNHLRNLINPLDRNFPFAGKRVLDFGCGTGALSVAMAKKGASVVGIDPTHISLQAARCRAQYFADEGLDFEAVMVAPDPAMLPFRPASFDVVITNSVMEFIPFGREQYVQQFLELLKPGGLLVISTENGYFPVDYYTRMLFPRFRRGSAIRKNVPYGLTYFELLGWLRNSGKPVANHSAKNYFNSVDKLVASRQRSGRNGQARILGFTNRIYKGVFSLLGLPSDLLLPYTTFIFRVGQD